MELKETVPCQSEITAFCDTEDLLFVGDVTGKIFLFKWEIVLTLKITESMNKKLVYS